MSTTGELPVLRSFGELGSLVQRHCDLYVRWSHGPSADLAATGSRDDLTGIRMPGLSASPLRVEPWWEDRPVELRVARRLHVYLHLPHEKGEGVRPWILRGRVEGRGPDNEPLVGDVEPVGWVDERVIEEAERAVGRQTGSWGPLRRGTEH